MNYYLDFVNNDNKKIAYATSILGGLLYRPVDYPFAGMLLDRFDFIGVRDRATLDFTLKTLEQKDVHMVADPCLFLDKSYITSIATPVIDTVPMYYLLANFTNSAEFTENKAKTSTKLSFIDLLSSIVASEYVVTDCFNVILLCLMLDKPLCILSPTKNRGITRVTELFNYLNINKSILYTDSIPSENIILQSVSTLNTDKQKLMDFIETSKRHLLDTLRATHNSKNPRKMWLDRVKDIYVNKRDF